MDQKTFNISIAAYLAILIPLPGRFIFGITLFIELILLAIVGTLILSLIKKLKLEEIKSFIVMISLVSFSILYRQILVITYSEIALTLGYYVFLPAVSILLLNFIFYSSETKLSLKLQSNIKNILIFSTFGLLFCLFRDIAGYGTFTFFGKNHQIFEKVLFNRSEAGIFSFVASIPGALVLSGILLFIQVVIKNKLRILRNAEVNNDLR